MKQTANRCCLCATKNRWITPLIFCPFFIFLSLHITVTGEWDKARHDVHKIYQNSLWGRQTTQLLPPLFHTAIDREGGRDGREGGRGEFRVMKLKFWRLEVKPLRRALLLLVQDVFLGLLEVLVGDFHAALAQSHEACFCADGLEDRGGGTKMEGNKDQTPVRITLSRKTNTALLRLVKWQQGKLVTHAQKT